MKVLSEEKLAKMADYIKKHIREENGEAPSFGDIIKYMEMSKSVGYRYLLALKERGIIEYNGKGTLSMKGSFGTRAESVRVAILGNVICGMPEEEHEYAEGYLALPTQWAGKDCFLLRAYGDSMMDAGITPGDLVLVKRCDSAREGQIVVALTEEGSTLKRLFFDGGKPRLHAENKNYPPEKMDIYPEKLEIQGVGIRIIKEI